MGQTVATGFVEELARHFVRGAVIDWEAIYRDAAVRKVTLPTYPFERQRCWFEGPPSVTRNGHHAHLVNGSPSQEGPSAAVDSRKLAGDLLPIADRLRIESDMPRYAGLKDDGNRLAALLMTRTLRQLGWNPRSGEQVIVSDLAAQLGVRPSFERLFRRQLRVLGEDGWLKPAPDGWQVVAFPSDDPVSLVNQLMQRYPACALDLELAERCSRRTAEVLRGEVHPLQVLFPDGDATMLERVYEKSLFAQFGNRLVKEAVASFIALRPPGQPLRILELGAGTGGTTAHLLPALPPGTEFVFTDVSNLFLARARDKFAAFPFVQYRLLDLERDPAEQGETPYRYDVVIAANVLHATADLRLSLRNARRLLAEHGLLVLLEGVGSQRLLDLVFGLTEGWWKFGDHDLRPDYPLLSRSAWLDLLRAEGFLDPTALAASASDDDPDQVVLLAAAPREHNISVGIPAPHFTKAPTRSSSSVTGPTLETLRAADPVQRRELLQDFLREQLACILDLPAVEIDLDASVHSLGLDSLMAIQLKNRIEPQIGVPVPVTAFLEGASGAQIVQQLLTRIGEAPSVVVADEPVLVAAQSVRSDPALLERVDELSHAELDALLKDLLEQQTTTTS